MTEEREPTTKEAAEAMAHRMAKGDEQCTFGPSFFLGQLRAFIRDRCPDPSEALPSVQLHLAEGEVLEICHLIGVAPHWLAVAAIETEHASGAPTMRTEIIPYALVSRVTVRSLRPQAGRIGFESNHGTSLLGGHDTPEEAFLAMAGLKRGPDKTPQVMP